MTTKKEILNSVRRFCIECSGGSKREAALCSVHTCFLHRLRFGRDPDPNQNTGFAKSNAYASDSLPSDLQNPPPETSEPTQ